MANEVRTINLLPGSKDGSFLTQFLNWALTIGRLLIILVETLALGTFLYRFNLDMKIVDLHDQIKAKSFIVENFASQEAEFRNLQARLALAKSYDEANTIPTIFQDITEKGKGKVTFRNVLVTSDNLKIEAEAPSAAALASFTDDLKTNPAISNLSVDKVENKTASATITIVLSAQLQTNLKQISLDTVDLDRESNAQQMQDTNPVGIQ